MTETIDDAGWRGVSGMGAGAARAGLPRTGRSWPWVVSVVAVTWLLIGVVLGSQTALGMTMQGTPVVLGDAIRTALINNLPWIPATLVAIVVARRYPIGRSTWRRALPVHLLAIPVVSWIANLGVVLGFWSLAGTFDGLGALARQAAFWATIRVHVAALVYIGTVALTHGWAYLRAARSRELGVARLETQLNRARFQALNAQIRPHFLFNTLHTIGQLWRSGRSDEAEEMLDHLGSLFQRVRSSTERPGISLSEELSMVEEYLAIEEARFADRLRTRVDVTDDARACVVPPLLLQPLVENAIRHGISPSPDAGLVRVEGAVHDGRLRIEVSDDGPGMDSETPMPGSGMGLANTRERLQHAFGEAATLRLSVPDDGRGTRVRIEIPATRDPDAALWTRS